MFEKDFKNNFPEYGLIETSNGFESYEHYLNNHEIVAIKFVTGLYLDILEHLFDKKIILGINGKFKFYLFK